MKLLATIKSVDVNPKAKSLNYATFTPRSAARVILFDDNKVALIHVSAHDYYMLPGGGIDDDDIKTGLGREVREEMGCEIEILYEVGSTDLYFDRWTTLQTDYCYIAKAVSSGLNLARTDFEEFEGHEIVWADNIDQAIELIEKAEPKEDDGKIVRARDLLFLQTAKNQIT
jgi:8-oxo-dGTP pyrophosphatase MutT (NUDIX family)